MNNFEWYYAHVLHLWIKSRGENARALTLFYVNIWQKLLKYTLSVSCCFYKWTSFPFGLPERLYSSQIEELGIPEYFFQILKMFPQIFSASLYPSLPYFPLFFWKFCRTNFVSVCPISLGFMSYFSPEIKSLYALYFSICLHNSRNFMQYCFRIF